MKRKDFELGLMCVVIVTLFFYYLNQSKIKEEIIKNHKETTGKIIDYYELYPASHYLTYEYIVNHRKFTKKINPDIEFKDCADNKACIGKTFLVYYDPNEPENSYILLDHPL